MVNDTAASPLRQMLSAHPCFGVLTTKQQDGLATAARPFLFQAEETVQVEGETAVGLWWIESGAVKIYKSNMEGSEQILHIAGPGETFNDIAVYDRGGNPANAAVLTPAKIWLLPSGTIHRLLVENNAFAQTVIVAMARRVRAFTRQIEDLTLYSVTARLARFLLQEADNPAFVEAGVTRKAIASYLATTPESVSRTLRLLQEAGAIQFDRYRIMIVNPALLRTIGQV
jgi:CRP/FNR family transcriptional regulator, dissimilatory nitrate respiration regulator